jgi:DNA repair protein RadD
VELRDYQSKIIDEARAAYRGGAQSVLINLATGGGKTFLASHMVQGAAARGNLSWWNCHRRELADQASGSFHEMGIQHSMVRAGFPINETAIVQVNSIPTLVRRMDGLPDPALIIFDEAHHIGAASWDKIFQRYPNAKKLGLTATPWRLDGKGLGRWFDTMVSGPSVADLMAGGSLSPYRLFAPSTPDLTGVATQAGEWQRTQLSATMDKPAIVGDAIKHYRKLCPGKRAIVFAVGVDHSIHMAAQFNEAGIPAEHVDGTMDTITRDAVIERFKRGETKILSNADLFGEGFDVPAIEAVILMRPTQSLSLYLQQVGRALRPAPGKEHAIILDHAGNSAVHGLPDDEREWSLEDRKKKKKGDASEISVRTCPECYAVFRPVPICPSCGHEFVGKPREIETVEGELQEIDYVALRKKKREQGKADTYEDLVALGKARGYKAGWAKFVWESRQKKQAA